MQGEREKKSGRPTDNRRGGRKYYDRMHSKGQRAKYEPKKMTIKAHFISIACRMIVAFIKAGLAISIGIAAGVAIGLSMHHGVSLTEVLVLAVSATIGVAAIMLIFKYKIFK